LAGKGWTALATAMTLAGMAAPAGAQGGEPDLGPVIAATVRIDALSTGRHGTGWVIQGVDVQNRAGAAVIATSYNIVEKSTRIRVSEPGATESYDAILLGFDTDRNIAFLEVKDVKARPLTLTRTTPKPGWEVWATGYNRASDETQGENRLAATATMKGGHLGRELRGPVSEESRAAVGQIEHDATLLPGFEGGPLVDRCARVVGINMKSGAAVTRRANLLIQPSAAVMNALRSDEVITAALAKGVKIDAKDGEACGGSAAAGSAATSGATADTKSNASAPPAASTASGSRFGDMFDSGNSTLLILAALLGLAAVGFGIYTLTRRQTAPADWDSAPPAPEPEPQARESASSRAPTSLPPALGETKVGESTLRLTGRGPAGEPIELSFSSSALQAGGMTVGVGANAQARIPDNRPDNRVSRLHARIAHDGRNFTIEDNKSLNKTFVGGQAIESHVPTKLVNGERIRLADVELSVSIS
jgi:hypothetical protein